jgi:hypothetical protein
MKSNKKIKMLAVSRELHKKLRTACPASSKFSGFVGQIFKEYFERIQKGEGK